MRSRRRLGGCLTLNPPSRPGGRAVGMPTSRSLSTLRRGAHMVDVEVSYEGDLHCRVIHGPSGTVLSTDAPLDSHGKGESFSPTDLVATALGTCILTVMGIAARSMQIDLRGARAVVRKEMTAKPVRRIALLAVTIEVPLVLGETQCKQLIAAAMTCPVHKSLHPDVQTPIEFNWG